MIRFLPALVWGDFWASLTSCIKGGLLLVLHLTDKQSPTLHRFQGATLHPRHLHPKHNLPLHDITVLIALYHPPLKLVHSFRGRSHRSNLAEVDRSQKGFRRCHFVWHRLLPLALDQWLSIIKHWDVATNASVTVTNTLYSIGLATVSSLSSITG
jgi:hypothetical protein